MALGWDDAAVLGLMAVEMGYHRFFDDPPKPQPAQRLEIPRTDDSAPVALIFGTCRVKQPIIAWVDKPLFEALPESGSPTYHYFMSMLLVLGIPFDEGQQKLLAMYAGDKKFTDNNSLLPTLKGDGTDYPSVIAQVELGTIAPNTAWPSADFGSVEFLNGNASQALVQDVSPYAAYSYAGLHMTNVTTPGANIEKLYGNIDPRDVPGYRGFLSVFLYNHVPSGSDYLNHWCVGAQASVTAYSLEVQSLPATFLGPSRTVSLHDGDITRETGDANPIDALYEILFGTHGKLGLDPTVYLTAGARASWQAAATTLYNEGNGYSNAFEGGASASDMVQDILRQIDGVMYRDPSDGGVYIKLIRNDYDTTALDTIDPSNCEQIDSFAAIGWTGAPTSVRLSFPNRALNYNDDSAVAPNEVNAVEDNGEQNELQLRMNGVREQANAAQLAARESAARGRPMMKLRAIVNRKFHLKRPGDVVKLNWPEWGINGVVFRIASVNRGTVENGKIGLDLLQDYYYVWRGGRPEPHGAAPRAPVTSVGP